MSRQQSEMVRYAMIVLWAAAGLGLSGDVEAFLAPSVSVRRGSFVHHHAVAQCRVADARVVESRPTWRGRGRAGGPLSMESTADFKNGMTIDLDGNPCKILEFLHVKPGKGSAFVRTKVKNLITGNSLEKTFRAGEPITLAQVDKLDLQFTYKEGNMFYFMNAETFEEVSIEADVVGDKADFMSEGMALNAVYFNGKTIEVSIPKQMVLEVVETGPGEKGNTAQGGSKPAKLETGVEINVPLFIAQGEKIRVDTETKKYMARANE